MNNTFHLPLADLGDVLQALLPIVFLILAGLSQLLGGKEKQKGQPKPRVRPRQQPEGLQGGPAPAAAGDNVEEKLRREVEEFMRRVQGKGKGEEDRPPQRRPEPQRPKPRRPEPRRPEPSRREVVAEQPVRDRPRQPLREQAPQMPQRAEGPVPELRSEGVAEHVSRHLSGARELATHAEHLADEIEHTDERLEAHLHQKFDRKLGSLERQQAAQPAAAPSTAGGDLAKEILNMMSKPGGMRQLIVANEILRRPEERWNE